ncbi:PEP-CTERM sorting domain-containing protein [Rhodospirillaceae bacterium SYSU D60014]|uniref:PEP-CTERM sorting domain-containing protein n=1 Tax=Virgifigura deserti TaxID=2268457 RepID=UPI000E6736AA
MKLKGILAAAVFLAFAAGPLAEANAVTINHLGNFGDNDDLASVNIALSGLGKPATNYLGKQDCDNDLCSSTTPDDGGDLNSDLFSIDVTLLKEDEEAIGGTWTFDGFTDGDLTWFVQYFTVKAGSGFALYEIIEPISSGTIAWDTSDLDNKGLSHISWFGFSEDEPTTEVSEPGILALLGAGLLAIGALHRRRVA